MKCEELNPLFDDPAIRSGAPLPGSAVEHLRRCPACRALLNLVSDSSRPPELRAELRSRIKASLIPGLDPVRPLAPAWMYAFSGLAVFAVLVAGGSLLMGSSGLVSMSSLQLAGTVGIMTAAALVFSRYLSAQMLPGRAPGVSSVLLGFVLSGILVASISLFFPWRPSSMFIKDGVPCFAAGLIVAIPASLVYLRLVRRGVFLSRSMTGATIGLLAGFVGGATLQFRCTILEASHLAVWHSAIVVASLLAGQLAGRLLESRSSTP